MCGLLVGPGRGRGSECAPEALDIASEDIVSRIPGRKIPRLQAGKLRMWPAGPPIPGDHE